MMLQSLETTHNFPPMVKIRNDFLPIVQDFMTCNLPYLYVGNLKALPLMISSHIQFP